jgi:hypothetical protein
MKTYSLNVWKLLLINMPSNGCDTTRAWRSPTLSPSLGEAVLLTIDGVKP